MWIIRRTSTRLIIWRTFRVTSAYVNALRVIAMIGVFGVVTGQLRTIHCYRLEMQKPITCDVTTGTIISANTQTLTDVRDVTTIRGSRSYTPVVTHANGETQLGGFDRVRIVSGLSMLLIDKFPRSFVLIDDLRWLGWLGLGIASLIALIGLIYTLFGDALVTISFDQRTGLLTLSQRFWLGKKQISQRSTTAVTDISLRQRRGMPHPQVTVLFGKERCLPLWETPEAKQMAELIRQFLDLPTASSPIQRGVAKHKRVTE